MSDVIGIPPMYANLPSCAFYLRAESANGNTRVRDWSINHVSITNTSVVNSNDVTPKFPPTYLKFAGGANLTVPYSSTGNSNNVLGANNFLASFFVRPTAWNPSGVGNSVCMGVGQNVGSLASLLVCTYNTGYRVWISSNGSTYDICNGTVITSSGSLNEWAHIMVGRSGNSITGYLNGSPVSLASTSASLYNSGLSVTIGTDHYTAPQYLNGGMDEIALWNGASGKVPSADQIWAVAKTRRMIV